MKVKKKLVVVSACYARRRSTGRDFSARSARTRWPVRWRGSATRFARVGRVNGERPGTPGAVPGRETISTLEHVNFEPKWLRNDQ